MKRKNKISVVAVFFVLILAAAVWAVETKWSAKLATHAAASMGADDMFLLLVDPNGTPLSRMIGKTEMFADWIGTTAITTLGTIATGTWQATDVGVPYGGTGVSTLTDGGILLGSGAGAITALGVATNGQIPIGDGTTDPVLATITGTASEITVTNGAGTITLSLPNDAGTDISADLEEEAHASEHQDAGADEIAVTAGMMNAGTGATASTFWRGDNTWGTPAGAGDMLKSTYDVSNDSHVDGNDVVYAAAWNADVNAPSMNAVYDKIESLSSDYQPLEATLTDIADGTIAENLVNTAFPWAANEITEADPLALLTAGTDNVKDTHIDWGSGAGQVNLADIPGGTAGASAFDFTSATSLAVPNAESADATLTALGQIHVRGDEDRISAHLGAGGEIAGEVTMSFLKRISVTLDPGSWYDSSAYVNLGPILAKQYPNGVIIDYWEATCHLDPDVEMDLDLCYSINDFDLADPNVVDMMDTTTGFSSEDTDANINAGAAIPAGMYLYLRFGADPEGTCVMLTVTILYHAEED